MREGRSQVPVLNHDHRALNVSHRKGLLILSAILWLTLGAAWPRSSQEPEEDEDACRICHGDASLFEDEEETRRLFVDFEAFSESVHGFLDCVDCHQDLTDAEFGHEGEVAAADCSACHDDVDEDFQSSLHGYARKRGNLRAPTCASCHGSHDIRSTEDPTSRMHRARIAEGCASCHSQAGLLTDQLVRLPQVVMGYAESVHGEASREGETGAAVCTDCHGVHDLRGSLDPRSRINRQNVSSTCGQCHEESRENYEKSIHGRALQAGISDSPTCTDCHGEHLILSPATPDAPTHAGNLALETCGRCHRDSQMIAKYGLADYVVETYRDSYHGWATRLESATAATCVDCHTAHLVLPERDPESTIHTGQLVETCGRCHTNATPRFVSSYTHRTASFQGNWINRWIRNVYWVLIPLVIGGMLLHNLVILAHYVVRKAREQRLADSLLRLDRAQRTQHLLCAVAFILLVITGFALRYPDSGPVRLLGGLGFTEVVRSWAHRISAIVLVVAGIFHVLYVLLSARGRREFSAMRPKPGDVKDLVGNLSHYLQPGERVRVSFGRYDYTQKAEYWAVVWGTLVMTLTGLVLWFPQIAVRFFPAWIVQASQTLHYYEAWLAALAIVVWHFFFVIFHPDEYPMNLSWLTGRMSLDSVRRHHREWYEEEMMRRSDRSRQEGPVDKQGDSNA